MRICTRPEIVAGLMLLASLACSRSLSAQANEWPVVFQNARFYLGIDVARLKGQLEMDAASDLGEIESMIASPTGMPAADAAKVALQFGADTFPDGASGGTISKSVGIVFSFNNEIAGESKLSLTGLANTEERSHNGVAYYKPRHEPCFLFSGETLLICEEARLLEHIDSSGDDREPPVALAGEECDIKIVGVFDQSGFGQFFAGIVKRIPCADRDLAGFIDSIVEAAAGFDIEVNLESDDVLVINLDLAEGKSIDELKKGASGLLAWGRSVFRDMFESLDRELPDGNESREIVGNLHKRVDLLLASAVISESTGGVVITVRSDGGASDIANDLVRSALTIIRHMNN